MSHRIFVVDDHDLMRKGYRFLIGPTVDLEVCGEAGSFAEAIERIPEAAPDLVVVDLSLEGTNGIELIKHLRVQRPDLPMLVVSMHSESLYAERALRAGANGYVMKKEVHTVVVNAIRQVLRGGIYLSDAMNRKMLLQYMQRAPVENTSPLEQLTDRELETFEHIGHGLTTRQVAEAMHISPKTVGTYRRRIRIKLALESSAELVQRAVQWIQSPDGTV